MAILSTLSSHKESHLDGIAIFSYVEHIPVPSKEVFVDKNMKIELTFDVTPESSAANGNEPDPLEFFVRELPDPIKRRVKFIKFEERVPHDANLQHGAYMNRGAMGELERVDLSEGSDFKLTIQAQSLAALQKLREDIRSARLRPDRLPDPRDDEEYRR
jgi:hypothetical protein